MKPIATLMKPLRSVDLTTLEASPRPRSNAAMSAPSRRRPSSEKRWSRLTLADALLEQFGGDSLAEIAHNYAAYRPTTFARGVAVVTTYGRVSRLTGST